MRTYILQNVCQVRKLNHDIFNTIDIEKKYYEELNTQYILFYCMCVKFVNKAYRQKSKRSISVIFWPLIINIDKCAESTETYKAKFVL